MEYVTYVCVGHGICFFKDYLFNPERIYGIRRNDKIILPDSDILVDIVKKHGWKEEDIFPNGLENLTGEQYAAALEKLGLQK
jgi:hypothetical protein